MLLYLCVPHLFIDYINYFSYVIKNLMELNKFPPRLRKSIKMNFCLLARQSTLENFEKKAITIKRNQC